MHALLRAWKGQGALWGCCDSPFVSRQSGEGIHFRSVFSRLFLSRMCRRPQNPKVMLQAPKLINLTA
jgi:hypothetical protein